MTASGTTLVLVRHGRTDWTDARRLQGRTDVPLNEAGRQEVLRLRPVVEEWRPRRVIASPAMRAVGTAELLCGEAPRLDERLLEAGLGEWEGLTPAEIGEPYLWWRRGHVLPPDGEPKDQVGTRVAEALRSVTDLGGVVLVVTHGGIIRAALEQLVGLQTAHLVPAAAPSMTVVELGEAAPRLRHYNLTPESPSALSTV